ncbi:MAG: SUMF1/EgtB/PvdO family nonheme iron enzyme [Chloroflexi bacterium]|nr:SUMF1/EgtB/PvdO family nonheme iron enzyme [Chloroflexota bacterium]
MAIPSALVEQRKKQLIELAKEALDLKGVIEATRLSASDVLEIRRLNQQKAGIDRQLNEYYTELKSLETQPDANPVTPETLTQGRAEAQKLAALRLQLGTDSALEKTLRGNFLKKQDLITLLLACPSIANRASRDNLLREVHNGRLIAKIARNDTDTIDLANIVNTLLDYTGALEELISLIRRVDSGSKPLQALENFQRVLLVDSFPSDSPSSLPRTRRLRVFLCWSWWAKANRALVKELHEKLLKDGVHSWYDINIGNITGQKRSVEVPKALRSSDVLVVLFSSAVLNASGELHHYFTDQLDQAENQPAESLALLTLKLDETELPIRLFDHSFLDYSGPDDYPALMQELVKHSARVGLELPSSGYTEPFPPSGDELVAVGQVIAGHYKLVRWLGKGAYGEVFEAEDIKFKPPRVVAIKLLHHQLMAERQVREEVEQEASLMAQFDHPNILQIFEFDLSPKLAYIVTKLAEGGSLADQLKRGQPLSLEEVARYLDPLAAAIDVAHSKHLIHRDIKPANILLNRQGEPWLADFGLAAALSNSQTIGTRDLHQMPPSGTPHYMAPEQWQGFAGKASDIYALGVLLYQMLAGVLPFQGNQMALANQHQNVPPPKLRDRAPNLIYPPLLDEWLAQILAKRPGDRPLTATEIALRFHAIIAGPKISELLAQLEEAETKQEWDRVTEVGEAILKLEPTHEIALPKTANGYLNRGFAYIGLQQYQQALEAYDRAIELKPDFDLAYLNRGNGYYFLKKYERAIQDYDRAIQLRPGFANGYYNRGLAYYSLKEYEKAIQSHDLALQCSPNYTNASYNRGLAYEVLKNRAAARRDFQKAAEAGLPEAKERLAKLDEEERRIRVVLDQLKKAAEKEAQESLIKAIETPLRPLVADTLVALLQAPQGFAPPERAIYGRALSLLSDPRPGVGTFKRQVGRREIELPQIEWCNIPKPPNGKFVMGSSTWKDNPRREVSLGYSFKMAKYLITYRQFQTFIASGEYDTLTWWKDFPKDYQPQNMREQEFKYDNHPREWVTWFQAVAFTRWLDAKYREAGLLEKGDEIRLPIEEEWEYAARGTDERTYPYGSKFDATKSNTYESGIGMTSAVGSFPDGASPFGVLDLSGNVWEWCLKEYSNPKALINFNSTNYRVLRGGSFSNNARHVASANRNNYSPDRGGYRSGFRLVVCFPYSRL